MIFEMSIPHLKNLEAARTPKLTKFFAAISELADKYSYIVFIGCSFYSIQNPTLKPDEEPKNADQKKL